MLQEPQRMGSSSLRGLKTEEEAGKEIKRRRRKARRAWDNGRQGKRVPNRE